MKLSELIWCEIYRDGGSLEGTWNTTENSQYHICLEVERNSHWPADFDSRNFRLYNCKLNDTKNHVRIEKGSPACEDIIRKVEQWMADEGLELDDLKQESYQRAFDLVKALRKGNY